MNDVYTGLFIVAAYFVFAWLWIEPRRPRWAFWTLLPVIGVLLGLALASKWVAAYAIGALGILILVRSALGRVVLIAGMVFLTGVLGWMAMAVPVNTTAVGQPHVHADHGRAHARDGRGDGLPPGRVVRRRDPARGRRPAAARGADRVRLDRARPGGEGVHARARQRDAARGRLRPRAAGRPRLPRVPGRRPPRVRADGAAAGARRPAPRPAARVAAARGVAPAGVGPRPADRVDDRVPAGDPARRVRRSRTCPGRSSRATRSSPGGRRATTARRSSTSPRRCTATTTT